MELIVALIALLCVAYVFGEDNERTAKLDKEDEIFKLDKEDEILHDLTACQEDIKLISYTGYHNVIVRRSW